jgi:hypothetical protein
MRRPFRLQVTSTPTWDTCPPSSGALAMILDRHPEGVLLVHGACPRGADAIAAAYAARTPGYRAEAGPGLTRGRKPDQRQHLESVYRQACRRHTAARDTHS